jgi:hypothetical protein
LCLLVAASMDTSASRFPPPERRAAVFWLAGDSCLPAFIELRYRSLGVYVSIYVSVKDKEIQMFCGLTRWLLQVCKSNMEKLIKERDHRYQNKNKFGRRGANSYWLHDGKQ